MCNFYAAWKQMQEEKMRKRIQEEEMKKRIRSRRWEDRHTQRKADPGPGHLKVRIVERKVIPVIETLKDLSVWLKSRSASLSISITQRQVAFGGVTTLFVPTVSGKQEDAMGRSKSVTLAGTELESVINDVCMLYDSILPTR